MLEQFVSVIDKSIVLLITIIEANDDPETVKLLCDNIDMPEMKKKLLKDYSDYVEFLFKDR